MPYVRDIHPLIGPAEGDGDLRPGAIAGDGDDVFRVDDEHPAGGELPTSSALSGGKAPKMVVTICHDPRRRCCCPQVVDDLWLCRRPSFWPITP